jgi:hypothetical protein
VHIDDLKNPEYRKGRWRAAQKDRTKAPKPPVRAEEWRRVQFATAAARAEFGRFYWNDGLRRRMERELENSRRLLREAERIRSRKRDRAIK